MGFFIKQYKNQINKKEMQNIYDYIFRQLELSIREIGYGDASINKKMKNYLNVFHSMLEKIEKWEIITDEEKEEFLKSYINFEGNLYDLTIYFNKYCTFLSKNPFNLFTKGVIKIDL